MSIPQRCPARRARAAVCLLALAILPGCVTNLVDPEAGRGAAAAVGVAEPIAFRVEGAPLDEPGEPAADLPLAAAIERAVRSDPRLQEALARVRIAYAESEKCRALPNPILDIALRFPAGSGGTTVEAGLTQEIVSWFSRPVRASAADDRLRAAAHEAVAVALAVAAEAEESYRAVQASEAHLAAQEERRGVVAELARLARARLELGEGSRDDLLAAEAERLELEITIAEREEGLRDERLRLARLVGEPSGAAAWAIEPWSAPPVNDADEAAWIAAALRHRPELRSLEHELEALGRAADHAGGWLSSAADIGVSAEGSDPWEVGPALALPLPLLDHGDADEAAARARHSEALHALAGARRAAVEEVRRALAHSQRTRERHARIAGEWLPLLAERRDGAERAFAIGLADLAAVLRAEDDLLAARAERIECEREIAVAALELRRAAGGVEAVREAGERAPPRAGAVSGAARALSSAATGEGAPR